ncbi:unnamed protein product [Rotaria sp. Silwood1]|nr:unnamed protein product [Rotaria sp. Silwood1]
MSTAVQNTTTSVRRLYVLLCGFEILPKTVSTRNLGAHIIMSEPISAYLLDTTEGWILVDSGIDETPHRLSTIERCDKIFVIHKGHLFEQGTHEELMENGNGIYRELVRRQRMDIDN